MKKKEGQGITLTVEELQLLLEAMEDEELQQFIRTGVYEEILPLLPYVW